jgi:hypothetical protein
VVYLCVNTSLATKITLITDGIKFGTLRAKETPVITMLKILGGTLPYSLFMATRIPRTVGYTTDVSEVTAKEV